MKRSRGALSGGSAGSSQNNSNRKGSSSSGCAAAAPAHQGGILRFLNNGNGNGKKAQPPSPEPGGAAPAPASASTEHKKKTITSAFAAAAARRSTAAASSAAPSSSTTVRFAPEPGLVTVHPHHQQEEDGEAQAMEEDARDPILARLLEASAQGINPPPTAAAEQSGGGAAASCAMGGEGMEEEASRPLQEEQAARQGDERETPSGPQEGDGKEAADLWRAEEEEDKAEAMAAPSHAHPHGRGESRHDIRSFLYVVPPPLRRRCPALPLPVPPKPYPANRYWRQAVVARPYDRPQDRLATRAAVAHLLVRRMRAFSSTAPTAHIQEPGRSHPPVQAVTLAAGMTGATVADPPSDMAFDPLGSLLAVGTTHGAVRVYDFDEALSAARTHLGPSSPTTGPPATLLGQAAAASSTLVQPLQMLEPRKAVSAVRWNPQRDSEVAVAFWHWPEVYVYDLETWSAFPSRTHRVGHRVKGAAGGNYSLAFAVVVSTTATNHPAGAGKKKATATTTLVAGSAYGVLRGWGLGAPDAVAWEVRTRGNGAITALCPCANGLLVGATASPEALYVWDVANLHTPILGATPAPTLLHTIDVQGLVRGLGCPSPAAGIVLVTTETGHLLQLDPQRGRVLSRQHVGRHDLAAVASLPGNVPAVFTHDASSSSASASSTTDGAAAAGPATAAEWPTAVYCPEGTPLAAAFPPRPAAAAAVGYRETGDEEAEAQDAVAEGGGMRAAAFDLTLPGVVLSAEEGAKTLRASDGALHRFLCPCPDQEGSAAAATATVAVRRRTSCVSIEGRVYAVRDLWPVYEEATVAQAEEQEKEEEEAAAGAGPGLEEEGPRRKRLRRLVQRRRRAVGTEIELVEPFHRRIAPEEAAVLSSLSTGGTDGGVRILAALRPVFEPTGAEGAAAGRRQWAHLLGTVPAAGAVSCLAVNPLTHHVVLGYAACGTYDILACERYRGAGEEEEKEGGAAEVVEIVE